MSAGWRILIVSAVILIIIGVIYSRYESNKYNKKLAFRRYWEEKGYRFGAWDEYNDEGYSLKKDDWELYVSKSQLSTSTEWSLVSELRTRRLNPERGTFALLYTASSVPFEEQPDVVRKAAVTALRIVLSDCLAQLSSVRTAFTQGGMACLAFEPEAGSAQSVIERLRPEITVWSGTMKLMIQSTPEHAFVRLENFYIDKPEEAEAVIRMGMILLEQNSI